MVTRGDVITSRKKKSSANHYFYTHRQRHISNTLATRVLAVHTRITITSIHTDNDTNEFNPYDFYTYKQNHTHSHTLSHTHMQ
jgi:hypothetical protein